MRCTILQRKRADKRNNDSLSNNSCFCLVRIYGRQRQKRASVGTTIITRGRHEGMKQENRTVVDLLNLQLLVRHLIRY